jgi:peptidoglycan/xylan/chitin deacetylase (PgdA/CDA1 family)
MKSAGLTGVQWTTLGLDWKREPEEIVDRVLRQVCNGAIICLHDGRRLTAKPDIRSTLIAVERLVPRLRQNGYRFETVGNWISG